MTELKSLSDKRLNVFHLLSMNQLTLLETFRDSYDLDEREQTQVKLIPMQNSETCGLKPSEKEVKLSLICFVKSENLHQRDLSTSAEN